MMETLGRLVDALLIIHLKMEHNKDEDVRADLRKQASRTIAEILNFIQRALEGRIPHDWLVAKQHKVHTKPEECIAVPEVDLLQVAQGFAAIQDEMWHNQERIYDFDSVPADKKDMVVNHCVELNLSRNRCMDAIDKLFSRLAKECE